MRRQEKCHCEIGKIDLVMTSLCRQYENLLNTKTLKRKKMFVFVCRQA